MAEITAQLVKDLREKTGAGMMDCKKALNENGGDMEAAVDWLRAKGLAKAASKAGRIAAEGLIGVALAAKSGAVVEVNSETDFVARNETFQDMVKTAAKLSLKAGGDVAKLGATEVKKGGKSLSETLAELVGKIGENMTLRRTAFLKVSNGMVASYVHSSVAPDLGKIGVLVALETKAKKEDVQELGRQLCMHVAAANPIALSAEEVPADVVERERAIFTEQAKESGKPANVVEKMVQGRIDKFFKEQVMLKQAFVIDPDATVEKAVAALEKTLDAPIKVTGLVRFALGEGIEKRESDFAAEVAAAAGGK